MELKHYHVLQLYINKCIVLNYLLKDLNINVIEPFIIHMQLKQIFYYLYIKRLKFKLINICK